MNQLPIQTRTQIINLLVEGNSLRATARITGVSRNTVDKLLFQVGKVCQEFQNKQIVNLKTKRCQLDEIWTFVGAKEKNVTPEMKEEGMGNIWTWTALDADSKMIVSWYVGDRSSESACEFMQDVAGRLKNRMQLTTDGHKTYLDAVEDASAGQVDYAMLVKIYGAPSGQSTTERKFSLQEYTGAKKVIQLGNPDKKHFSTYHMERQNPTMRMNMRRFTRLTNAFSKKLENHCYAIALHFVYYNFAKIHQTLHVTPAMEAGLTKDIMSIEDIVRLTEK